MLCSVEDVKMALRYPGDDLSRFSSDEAIASAIETSEDEINTEYRTKFIQDVSNELSVTSATSTSITPSSSMTAGRYNGNVLYVTEGKGQGQYRIITNNDTTIISIERNFEEIPDASSKFKIVDAGIEELVRQGYVHDKTFYLTFTPVLDVVKLEYGDEEIPSDQYDLYNNSGKVDVNETYRRDVKLRLNERILKVKYLYGETKIQPLIKRLCVIKTSMKILTTDIAGTRDEIVRWNLPGAYADKGELYRNIDQALVRFRMEEESIKQKILRPRILVA